ncbi:MAG: orotate phosphoribosyltransferase [Helicobacteraceae bacterium]|jgi:orotate phosphoribosyltransferase|nr:orotate phosphoribosyltransferase [Helicobacteraceae bacterium]
MNIEQIYKDAGALLSGHFLLSSGKHSPNYLQSAKVLEDPRVAEKLAVALAEMILSAGVKCDLVCAPALGGVLAGYELARALGARSIFAERANGEMTLRRGFTIKSGEKVIICEDIITTGGSAMEAAKVVEAAGGNVAAFAALANRGVCVRSGAQGLRGLQGTQGSQETRGSQGSQEIYGSRGLDGSRGLSGELDTSRNSHGEACKLPFDKPFFALADFDFPIYDPDSCPLCAASKPVKPGSRGN